MMPALLFGASALPATSHDRYLMVADDDNVNGAEYVGLVSVGVVPLVVYCVLATPDPPVLSVAAGEPSQLDGFIRRKLIRARPSKRASP
jgi:hypothetical protein